MSTPLLEAAQALVAADREERKANNALVQAKLKCAGRPELDLECIRADREWESAYRAMFEAQKKVLAEARKAGAR